MIEDLSNTNSNKKRKIDLILPLGKIISPKENIFDKKQFDKDVDQFINKKLKKKSRNLLQTHMVRFLQWNSSSINSMCVNPSENLVAIGRADSSIEIRNILVKMNLFTFFKK